MSNETQKRRLVYRRPNQVPNPRPSSRANVWSLAWDRLSGGWLPLLAAMIIVTATHWPGNFHAERRIMGLTIDRFIHAVMYGGITIVLAGFLAHRGIDSFWRANWRWLTPAILLVAGALDEATQGGPFHRSPSVRDWLADAAGIIVASVLTIVVYQLRRPGPRADSGRLAG